MQKLLHMLKPSFGFNLDSCVEMHLLFHYQNSQALEQVVQRAVKQSPALEVFRPGWIQLWARWPNIIPNPAVTTKNDLEVTSNMNDCILTESCDRTTLSKNLQAFLFEGPPSFISLDKIPSTGIWWFTSKLAIETKLCWN